MNKTLLTLPLGLFILLVFGIQLQTNAQTYCTPTGDFSSYSYITEIVTSGGGTEPEIENFSQLMNTPSGLINDFSGDEDFKMVRFLTPGNNDISMDLSLADNNQKIVEVFVDWYGEGLSGSSTPYYQKLVGSGVVTVYMTVPVDANIGDARMRIMVYSNFGGTNQSTPCSMYNQYGESGSIYDFTIQVVAPFHADYNAMDTGDDNWCPGETRDVELTVTNDGTEDWTNGLIGVKWNEDANYTTVDANDLASGATETYTIAVTAPITAGTENLTFNVQNEDGDWFGTDYVSEAINIVNNNGEFAYDANAYCLDEGILSPLFVGDAIAGMFSSDTDLSLDAATGEIDLLASLPGTYTITNELAIGTDCATSYTFEITINPLPTVDAGEDLVVCEGEMVTLEALGSDTYVWDQSVEDGIAFTPEVGTTTYTLTGTDANGCENTDAVEVTVNPLPTVTIDGAETLCLTNGISEYTGSPAGGVFSGEGMTDNALDPEEAGVGTHTIMYTYADANGCENSAALDIVIDDCAGIYENKMKEVKLSPNPASQVVTVSVGENSDIQNVQLVSIEGKVVPVQVTQVNAHKLQLDVSSVVEGTYFVWVISTDGQAVQKLIVQ